MIVKEMAQQILLKIQFFKNSGKILDFLSG